MKGDIRGRVVAASMIRVRVTGGGGVGVGGGGPLKSFQNKPNVSSHNASSTNYFQLKSIYYHSTL